MKSAESPEQELARLAALSDYRVLDSPREAVYDAITRLAAQICGVPIAIISLVDRDRLWFKSVEGWPGVNEIPRHASFCDCAIQDTGLLEVRNAARDPRFRDHPLVKRKPKIRFYAGMPLVTAEGHGLGTLCVMDVQPGALSAVQHAALKQLSEVVMRLFESGKTDTRFQRLEQVERHFRATFEQVAVGMAHTTVEGRFVEVNRKLCEMVGYSRDELMRMKTLDLSPPADRGRYAALYQEIVDGKRDGFAGEKQWVRKDGIVIWVNRTVSRAGAAGDPQSYLIQVIEDISERKRIECSVARLARARRVMAEANQILVHAANESDLLQKICDILVQSGGYCQAWIGLAEDDADKSIRVAGVAGYEPGYLEHNNGSWADDGGYQGVMGHVIATGEVYVTQNIWQDKRFSHRQKRAAERGYQSSFSLPLKIDGRCIGGISIYAFEPDAFDADEIGLLSELVKDVCFGISALRMRSAHEQAGAVLRESEQRARELFNQAAVGILLSSVDMKIIDLNQRFADIVGCSRQELIGTSPVDITHAEDREELSRSQCQLLSGESGELAAQKRYLRKDGGVVWVNRTFSLARSETGEPLYFISVVEDITQRKQVEQRVAIAFDQAAVGIAQVSMSGKYLLVNKKLCDILGYSAEELIGHHVKDFTYQDDPAQVARNRSELVGGTADSTTREKRYRRKDGKIIWCRRTMSLARDAAGNPLYTIRVIEDITEHKQIEESYRATVRQAPVGIFHSTLDLYITQVNPRLCEILGYSEAELLQLKVSDIIHPSNFGLYRDKFAKLAGGELESFSLEQLFVRKDGGGVWVSRMVSVVRDFSGQASHFIQVIQDISARREAEERERATVQQAPVGIVHNSPDGRILQVNPKFCEIVGYSEQELLSLSNHDILHPEDRGRERDGLMRQLLAGDIPSFATEKRFVRKDGRVIYARRTVSVVRDAAGKPLYLVRIVEDVTERTQAEERYRATFDYAPVGIMHTDLERRILRVNDRMCEMLGYAKDELLRMTTADILSPEYVEVDRAQYWDDMLEGKVKTYSSQRSWIRKDGGILWTNRTVSLVRDPAGKPLYFIRMIEDISARKHAEDVLRQKNALTSLLEALAVAANQARSPEEAMQTCISRICDYTGWPVGHGVIFGEGPADHEHQISLWVLENAARWQKFKQASEPYRYSAGTGALIGTLIDSRQALWVRDVAKHSGFYRAAAAAECGIKSGFAFPVIAGEKVVAFLEFYSDEVMEPDESLMRVFNAIGAQLGRVTERRIAEIALRTSEETFRTAFSQASVGITVAGLDQRYMQVNDKYCEITGYSREELLNGMGMIDLNPPEDAAEAIEYRRRLVAGEAAGDVREKRLRRKDGTLVWVALVTSVVRGASGDPKHFISVIQDISERRQAEQDLRDSEERYRDLFDLTPQPIWVLDVESQRLVTVNQAAVQKYGYTLAEFQGMPILNMHVEEDREKVAQQLRERDPNASVSQLRRHLTKSGKTIIAEVIAKPLEFQDRPSRIILINDITDWVQTENALRESEELFRQLAGNIPQVFWISDASLKQTIYISPACEQMLGLPVGEVKANPRKLVEAVHPEDRIKVKNARKSAAQGRYDETYRIVRPDGAVRWIQDRAFPVRDAEGRVYRVAGIAEDITQRKEAEEKLVYFAHYDGLTGLSNRVLFRDRLEQTMAQGRRRDWLVGVIMLDLDRFKIANDTLGHSAGDMLLKQVAGRLTNCVRPGDTVGRFSGDEFGIILSDLRNPGDVRLVAQKILNAFAEPFKLDASEIHITASIGISLYPSDSDDCDTLIKYADTALHRAKDSGRNNFQFYTTEMNVRALHRLNLENNLRHALERQEFLLHYQPKASLSRGVTTGLEALLRWQHPQFGLVSPVEFVPVLEETGLIIPVGEWVIGAVCTQIKAWEAAGIQPVPVAINLSGRQFLAQDLGSTVKRLLDEHKIDSGLIELEITESSLMVNTEEAVQTLKYLNSLGVSLAIDDFGTGYSSLSYLKRFPLDSLKIDRSFVRDITSDAEDAAITRAVISMAHSLGLKVVAEGVETEAQMSFLAANACDEIQGYYLARPLTVADCGKWLQQAQHISRPVVLSGTQAPTVLVVDDDEDMLILIERALSQDGYRILTANDAGEGFEVLSKHKVDVVISDHEMPGMTGVEFLQRVKSLYPDTVRLMNSGHTDFQTVADAVNKGEVFRFVPKHADHKQLRMEIREALAGRATVARRSGYLSMAGSPGS